MSRYVAAPTPSYDPTLRINGRQQPEGGAPRVPIEEVWAQGLRVNQQELLLFIHGFNNHLGEAEGAYQRVRDRAPALKESLQSMLGDVFWPGDAKWAGVLDRMDFMFYPQSIGAAKTIAPAIAEYLRTRPDILQVHFLAHSMGCRVTLEVIRSLMAQSGGPKIAKVCLMAAAVPTYMTCPGGLLCEALTAGEHVRILYSPADVVLMGAFPPGQTMGGEGFFPVAVGRHGDVLLHPGHVERDHIPGCGHSDYWGSSAEASALAGQSIAEFFRFDSGASRSLRARPAVPARPNLPDRTMPNRGIGDYF